MLSSHSLAKQKRRLSMLFSLSIFLIILVLDIGFLSFKYFDYGRQEFGKLSLQTQGIIKVIRENPNFEQDVLQGRGFSLPTGIGRGGMMMNPTGGRQGMRRGIQMDNFFLYSKQSGEILFSPRKDDELYSALLKETQSMTQEGKTSFKFNEGEYLFLNTPITQEISVVFFTESRMTPESILIDILMYLGGAIFLSLGVYVISSRFVDNTLAPVEENMDQMEQFIHNAGHELKTPISVIKSSLELMRLSKNYDEGITESIGELNRMNGLIQALISLATLDNLNNSESINLKEICEQLEKNYEEQLEKKKVSLQIIEKKPCSIQANKEYTEILLSNLFSNAIKYNKIGGVITISIDEKSITIQDTGIGIAKDNLKKVFDRFYQETEGRDENSFGIGLSLVERIASIYKWKVTVQSEKGIGTTVRVEF